MSCRGWFPCTCIRTRNWGGGRQHYPRRQYLVLCELLSTPTPDFLDDTHSRQCGHPPSSETSPRFPKKRHFNPTFPHAPPSPSFSAPASSPFLPFAEAQPGEREGRRTGARATPEGERGQTYRTEKATTRGGLDGAGLTS